jgi:nucleotide-binding universal stress UspA family protein
MTTEPTPAGKDDLLVGFDGSPDAAGAIELGARLLPGRTATIAHLWAPPYARPELRSRVSRRTGSVKEMIELLEREARAEAERVAAEGVTLAIAAGWRAEPLVRRSLGGVGLELAELAEERMPAAVVVGSRGLTGVRAVLGSVSDEAVHASPAPVLVVPSFILTAEREAAASGPVLVGHDGSEGSERALDAAATLLGGRERIAAFVGEEEHAPVAPEGVPAAMLAPIGVSDNARAVADALVRHAQAEGAAVIVVGSRGRSAVQEILLGSVAMAVLHHTDRPVLVVPAR